MSFSGAVANIQEARQKYLHKLYEMTRGDTSSTVNMNAVGAAIDLSDSETNKVAKYLSNEQLIKFVALGGEISITHQGIKFIEERLLKQDDVQATPRQAYEELLNAYQQVKNSVKIGEDKEKVDPVTSHAGFTENKLKTTNGITYVSTMALSDKVTPIEKDSLDYTVYADALVDFITHPQTKPPFSLAISGSWGCGKTTLMEWVRAKLAAKDYPTTWFTAWRYNKHEQIWAALASQIIADTLTPKLKLKLSVERFLDTIPLPRTFYKWSFGISFTIPALILVLLVTKTLTIHDIISYYKVVVAAASIPVVASCLTLVKPLCKMLRSPLSKLKSLSNSELYGKKLGFQDEFEKDFMRLIKLVSTEDKPLIVFIDDLDRAPAPLPVEVIEAMNILLNQHNCFFILGMDLPMVAASIEAKYSAVIDSLNKSEATHNYFSGNDFLDKLIQMNFHIPTPTRHQVNKFIDSIFDNNTGVHNEHVSQISGGTQLDIADFGAEHVEERVKQLAEREEIHFLTRHYSMYLPNNPRKIKRFINTFRLTSFIANRRGLINDTIKELNVLAAITVIVVEYPEVYRILHSTDYKQQLSDENYENLILNKAKAKNCNVKDLLETICFEKDLPKYLSVFSTVKPITNDDQSNVVQPVADQAITQLSPATTQFVG